jgi:hypothetical protein
MWIFLRGNRDHFGLNLKTIEGWFVGLGLKTGRGQFGHFGLKTIGDRFDRFRPQNRGAIDRRTYGGILELALR